MLYFAVLCCKAVCTKTSTAIIVHDLFTHRHPVGCAQERAPARSKFNTGQTTHIFSMRNDSSKCYFRNSIENHFFNYNQNFFVQFNLKSFFIHTLTLVLSLYVPLFSSSIWHCDSVIWCVIIAIQFIKYLFVSF